MQQLGFVLVLSCGCVLTGLVIGLRFNVRLLVLLCLAAIAIGIGAAVVLPAGAGHPLTATLSAIVALQFGYFGAVVLQAMRMDELPLGEPAEAAATLPHDAALPPRA
jgi:hypothetical protein